MFRLTISVFLFIAVILQGCVSHQVLGEHVRKGMLVKEESAGAVVEHSRTKRIEMLSPLSIRVYEEVEQQENIKRYYQKVRIRSEATPKEFPTWDVWTKLLLSTTVVPLFTPDYWIEGSYLGPNCRLKPNDCTVQDVESVLSREYVVENGARLTRERRQNVPKPDTVSLFINGVHKGDLQINSEDVAMVDLHLFPDLGGLHMPLKLTFKYHDAYAYSLLPQEEFEKSIVQSMPVSTPGRR